MTPARDRDGELAELLESERPVPTAAFRGELRRSLLREPVGGSRMRLVAYAGSGALLLAGVALGVLGVGPLAA